MKNAARKLLVTTMMLASALSYAEIKAENSTTTPQAHEQMDKGMMGDMMGKKDCAKMMNDMKSENK